jgi:hypothetical protein
MILIRLSKNQHAKAWRALIEIGPIHRLLADDPIYEVMPAHVEMLMYRGYNFEVNVQLKRRPIRRIGRKGVKKRRPLRRE